MTIPKSLLSALLKDETEEEKLLRGAEDALSDAAPDMLFKALSELVKSKGQSDGVRHEFDDAFVRTALNDIRELALSSLNGIASGKVKTDNGIIPPLQLVYLGERHKKNGRPIAVALPQGMGVADPNNKRLIMEAIAQGVELLKGKIMVATLDEAWTYETKDSNDPTLKNLLDGGMRLKDMAAIPGKVEAIVVNVVGYDFQYLMRAPIIRHPDGTVTLGVSEVTKVGEDGVHVEGRLVVERRPKPTDES